MRKGGSNIQIRHLSALGRVNVHVGTLHRHKFVTRSLNHTHLLDASCDGSLLRLVSGDDVAVPVQQLVKRERAVRDGYGIERMSSDSGILLGIILYFCHFLSVLRGLTK